MSCLLQVENMTKRFGGLVANSNISFECSQSEIISLIGPNGAGKTTAFNCINGFLHPDGGSIKLNGQELIGKPVYKICQVGIARTFQIVKIIETMSTIENVMVGAFCNTTSTVIAKKKALKVMEIVQIEHLRDTASASLTLAQKRRVEMARALATQPILMLLDECMAGLTISEIGDAMKVIRNIRDIGISVVLVEHIMEAVMSISDRIVVINFGEKIADGTPIEIASNQQVINAYLGEEYHVSD